MPVKRAASLLLRSACRNAWRLPRTRLGDTLFWFVRFLHHQRRLPRRIHRFNDVLYHMKTGGRLSGFLQTVTTDKDFVKHYVAGVVGEAHVVPTIAVLKSEGEIDAFPFPRRCCVKATAGSGRVAVVRDGTVDREMLKSWLRGTHHDLSREQNYRALRPKVIVEPFLFDAGDVNECKVFCWNGEARCILYVNSRFEDCFKIMFDRTWQRLPIRYDDDAAARTVAAPSRLDEMLGIAERLSRPFDLVRIDFYVGAGTLLVGEITHCHMSAERRFASLAEEEALSRVIFGARAGRPLQPGPLPASGADASLPRPTPADRGPP
jgi:hypothetical protein